MSCLKTDRLVFLMAVGVSLWLVAMKTHRFFVEKREYYYIFDDSSNQNFESIHFELDNSLLLVVGFLSGFS